MQQTIDGRAAPSEHCYPVFNPATGAQLTTAPICSDHQLAEAMRTAAQAGVAWSGNEPLRRSALRTFADALAGDAGLLAEALTSEQGKPLGEARQEITAGIEILRAYAELSLPLDVLAADGPITSQVGRQPCGVVAAIIPWNFPFSIAMSKLGAALLGGNTVVLKPSPFTPVTTLLAGALSRETLPAGVANFLSGGDDLGSALVRHPTTRAVTFTGSVASGKAVARAAASDLKRLVLELGGNDAAIVLPDADPAAVAADLCAIAFRNCGQICATVKRLYVHASIHDQLVGELSWQANCLKVGNGMTDGVQMGPLQNQAQLQRITTLVAEAVDEGAVIAAGGRAHDGPGYFYPPTVLTRATDGMRIVAEEQFGPALPVLRYEDVDEAVTRANNSTFGLTSSVWGTDPHTLRDVAERLDTGVVNINTHDVQIPGAPFSGRRWSGLGAEGGIHGVLGLTDARVLNIAGQ
ncbi:aldehyde dehydrogenase family protein [Nonomuraea ceibae]|uniref:aldehyde dehydrogenase family protein n=1 Tax=Nonomuraea ceibae TaxID=1935170 RepID=UPI0027E0E29E|nr:aldehyde dehydrogenase family protein [Nonomuraea ceibae]